MCLATLSCLHEQGIDQRRRGASAPFYHFQCLDSNFSRAGSKRRSKNIIQSTIWMFLEGGVQHQTFFFFFWRHVFPELFLVIRPQKKACCKRLEETDVARGLVVHADVAEQVGHGLAVVDAANGLRQDHADVHRFDLGALQLLQLVGDGVGHHHLSMGGGGRRGEGGGHQKVTA